MLPQIEYRVGVPVSTELAFRAFSDLNRLLGRGVYDSVSWVEGKPWEIGSRLRYVVNKPVQGTIHAVITAYETAGFIALIYHAFGVSAEQQVTFSKTRTGANVHLLLEFVGTSIDLPDDLVRQTLTLCARDSLDTMAGLCRQGVAAGSSG